MKLVLFIGTYFVIHFAFLGLVARGIRKGTLSSHGYALLFSGTWNLTFLTLLSLGFIFSRAEVDLFTVAFFSGVILLNFAIGYPIAFFLFKALKPMIDSQRQRD